MVKVYNKNGTLRWRWPNMARGGQREMSWPCGNRSSIDCYRKGDALYWHESGELSLKCSYKNGMLDGLYQQWWQYWKSDFNDDYVWRYIFKYYIKGKETTWWKYSLSYRKRTRYFEHELFNRVHFGAHEN